MRLLLFLLLLFSILVTSNVSDAKSQTSKKQPFSAFTKYPLKGTINAAKIVSRDRKSGARYIVTGQYQMACKASRVVLNYPPRYLGKNSQGDVITSSTEVKFSVTFDAIELVNPSKNSNHFVSSDIFCTSYRDLWYMNNGTGWYNSIVKFEAISLLRYAVKYPTSYGLPNNARWCRSPIVGLGGNFEYDMAIFSIVDRRIYYFLWTGGFDCTNNWVDVLRWQREGWYLIQ